MERLGRYEILAELGHGAMGTVYRARDPKIGRVVALKTIKLTNVPSSQEQEFRERFFREAQAAGRLSHPGIVTIHDVGEDEATRTPYLVMELLEGRTLEELTQGERPSAAQVLDLTQQLARALDYAHRNGIVHRDIKPANIIVTPGGRARITDFGIAKLQTAQLTQPGQVLGTPAYMAPEQLTGGAVDGRSDLFSLGVLLYWLLTGDKPFPGETTTSVTFKVVYQEPIPPLTLNPALSEDYNYVVLRALAKKPEMRYQSGEEFAHDIDDLKNSRPPRSRATAPALAATPAGLLVESTSVSAQPRPPSPDETTPLPRTPLAAHQELPAKRSGTRRLWLLSAGVVFLLLLALLAAGWWGSRRSAARPGAQAPAVQQATTDLGPPVPATQVSSTPSGSASPPPAQDEPPPLAEPRTRPPQDATGSEPDSQPRSTRGRGRGGRRSTPAASQASSGTLIVRGEHNFDPATLKLWIDQRLVRTLRLSNRNKKFTFTLPVRSGQHTIVVRVEAPRDGFDQIRDISGRLQAKRSRTLEVSFGRLSKFIGIGELTRKLELRWLD